MLIKETLAITYVWISSGEECFALLDYLSPFLLGEPLVASMHLSHFPKTFIASEAPKLFRSKGLTQQTWGAQTLHIPKKELAFASLLEKNNL